MVQRSEHEGRAYCSERERQLLRFDKVPGSAFSKYLACYTASNCETLSTEKGYNETCYGLLTSISILAILLTLFPGQWIPVILCIRMVPGVWLVTVENRGERGCQDLKAVNDRNFSLT